MGFSATKDRFPCSERIKEIGLLFWWVYIGMATPSTDLITLDRAKGQLKLTGNDTLVGALITGASAWMEQYCRRKFKSQTYDELQDGTGTPYLYVDNPPCTYANVRTGLMPAIFIQCSDPGALTQAATVEVLADAIVLTKVYNGTPTISIFPYADYTNFTSLKTGINALGNGWQAQVPSNFNLWQTSDLAYQLGSFSARNISCELLVYWWTLPFFKTNPEFGEIFSPAGFCNGYQAYRVTYVGGFDPIPEDLQDACCEVVQVMYAQRNTNPLMNSETIDKYTYVKATEMNFENLSLTTQQTLKSYKISKVSKYQ